MPKPIIVVGSLNMDLIVRTPRFPAPGETLLGGVFSTAPGGKGANQAVAAARKAFDGGPWPRMTHKERAVWLNKIADAWTKRAEAFADTWTRESGVLHSVAKYAAVNPASTFWRLKPAAWRSPSCRPGSPRDWPATPGANAGGRCCRRARSDSRGDREGRRCTPAMGARTEVTPQRTRHRKSPSSIRTSAWPAPAR